MTGQETAVDAPWRRRAEILPALADGQDLAGADTEWPTGEVTRGAAGDAGLGGLLVRPWFKGGTVTELDGLVRAMDADAVRAGVG
ncbi:hypothetical protein [Microbispora sp. NPDC046933]|uniref:hypothetical protein n=1 Tax=Microbispora sp. NPDC046933 TaxID=3155618 RepID=UPI0033DA1C99